MQIKNGFTLLELVFAMTLSSLIFTAISGMLFAGILAWQKGVAEIDTRYNLHCALERMLQETREAAVLPVGSGGTVDYFDLQLPNTSLSAVTAVHYRFDAAGGEIQRNSQPIASKITGLFVDFTDFPLIRIRITGRGYRDKELFVQGAAAVRALLP